jgi:hypothetical protein
MFLKNNYFQLHIYNVIMLFLQTNASLVMQRMLVTMGVTYVLMVITKMRNIAPSVSSAKLLTVQDRKHLRLRMIVKVSEY